MNVWQTFATQVAAIGERLAAASPESGDPQRLLELHRLAASGMAMGYFGLFCGDADHPDFWPMVNQAFNYLVPNPDSTYIIAPVDGGGVYRLSGFRGSVRTVDVQIGSSTFFTRGIGAPGPNVASHDLDELHLDADGAFDVILSAERPAGHAGDWWQLGAAASCLLIRQTAYDWHREVDGRFAIERLDRPAVRPRPSAERIANDLAAIPVWAETWTTIAIKWGGSYAARGLVNRLALRDLTAVGGVGGQAYIEGQFELGPGEALLYETELPERCRYWNVQLTDLLWSALDYTHRHTSLNGLTARLDPDGRFRAVISAEDPGVPNWLDTMGYPKGTILGRWTQSSSTPLPTLRKVDVLNLRRHLPAETPVVTPQQRETDLRHRRKGLQLRRRW